MNIYINEKEYGTICKLSGMLDASVQGADEEYVKSVQEDIDNINSVIEKYEMKLVHKYVRCFISAWADAYPDPDQADAFVKELFVKNGWKEINGKWCRPDHCHYDAEKGEFVINEEKEERKCQQ